MTDTEALRALANADTEIDAGPKDADWMPDASKALIDAADTIDALRAEVAKVRAAIERYEKLGAIGPRHAETLIAFIDTEGESQ